MPQSISFLDDSGATSIDIADLPTDWLEAIGVPLESNPFVGDPFAPALSPESFPPDTSPVPSVSEEDPFLYSWQIAQLRQQALAERNAPIALANEPPSPQPAIAGFDDSIADDNLELPQNDSLQAPFQNPPVMPTTKEQWQAAALQKAGIDTNKWNPSEGYRGNQWLIAHLVYDYYQSVFQQNNNLQWAGMARLAGGAVLNALDNSAAQLSSLTDQLDARQFQPPAPGGAIDIPSLEESGEMGTLGLEQSQLLSMQKFVFQDLAWQLEAYLDGGMGAIDQAHANKEINDEIFAAWQQIDNGIQIGNQTEISLGNRTLLRHEQRDVLQRQYDKFKFKGVGNVAAPIATSMVTNPTPGGAPFTGNDITNLEQRWAWVDTQVRQPFLNLTPAQRDQFVSQTFGQEITFNRNQPKGKNIP